ncbi:hypothetical protein B566_EDAN010470 [Ephemera danica]|nr:hypothetical protein B566_EDAN010470 [Ephemera danica]
MSDNLLSIIQAEDNQIQRHRMDNQLPEPRCINCRYHETVPTDMVDLAIAEESGEGPWREGSLTRRQMLALDSGYMTDCTFLVGTGNDMQTFRCHSLLLCWASPNFTSKLRGMQQQQQIRVQHVQPRFFRKLLEYIYGDHTEIEDMETTLGTTYAARRLGISTLAQRCSERAKDFVNAENICQALELAVAVKNQSLHEFCLQYICNNAEAVLASENIVNIELTTLEIILQEERLRNISEIELFSACHRWAEAHASAGITPREALGSALRYIRFRTVTAQQFASAVCTSKLLSTAEESAIFCCIVNGVGDMPEGFSNSTSFRNEESSCATQDVAMSQVIVKPNNNLEETIVLDWISMLFPDSSSKYIGREVELSVNGECYLQGLELSAKFIPMYHTQPDIVDVLVKLSNSGDVIASTRSEHQEGTEQIQIRFNPPCLLNSGINYTISSKYTHPSASIENSSLLPKEYKTNSGLLLKIHKSDPTQITKFYIVMK